MHTGIAVGFLASIVTIIGFFGIHPPEQAKKDSPKHGQSEAGKQSEPPKMRGNSLTSTGPAKSRGIGTFHLEGGFPTGQSFISRDPLPISDHPGTAVLVRPGGGEETLREAVVVASVEMNQSVSVWRKGSQFIRGVRFVADRPILRLSGGGIKAIDVELDSNGRIRSDIVWPVNGMFTTAEFLGPVRIGSLDLGGGIVFGESGAAEATKTLPVTFKLSVPKPGEVLAEFKADFQFPTGSPEARYVVVYAEAPSHEVAASWSAQLSRGGPTTVRDDRADLFDRGLYALKILYSSNPQ
jgi:hypothetical protein